MILNINKPKNWTSFDVVAKVRSQLNVKKAGHAGTLDPLAEGVLVVLTGKDTKRQAEFMKQNKEYIFEIGFGATSPTYDLEGELKFFKKPLDVKDIKNRLTSVLPEYTGEITQKVPAYSAKKVGGKPLYRKARKGTIDLEKLPSKKVTVYEFEVLEVFEKTVIVKDLTKTIPVARCRVACSSGTYIRSLAHDIGADLGVGGVLLSLVRTKIGDYFIEDAVKIGDLANLKKN